MLITESLGRGADRQVTVHVPPETVDAVVYAADGAWHAGRLSGALEDAGQASTMIVGVHGPESEDGRLRAYVPGFDEERFAATESFVVEQVAEWVAARFGVAPPPERTAVWGASLGGELALALGLRHPDVYGAALVASPGAGYPPPAVLPPRSPRLYLVAGTEEPFFLDNARRWAAAIRRADGDVVLTERSGGHGDAFWFEEFPLMVAWAFGHGRPGEDGSAGV